MAGLDRPADGALVGGFSVAHGSPIAHLKDAVGKDWRHTGASVDRTLIEVGADILVLVDEVFGLRLGLENK